ncbi:hypothetical protein SS50377_23493 [Spironucleus salmonicida]|uniref:Uncharacterized protein n=1 Tax=Spironucleus salmonicida TaxID=348837 RepID=V6LNQ7_9EUKA|nr:hypothetical protein SS50377_23493 [Spironucleus salmonicida]|eukprot:EST46230.1 Hypothetical protein SS50377_13826 [Spironucleus salmonicida]
MIKKQNNQYLVSVEELLKNPQLVINQCKNLPIIPQTKNDRTNLKQNYQRFRWTSEPERLFDIIVTALGIRDIKPRSFLQYFSSYDVNSNILSSKIQKHRLKLIRQYSLENINQIQNYHYYSKRNSAIVAQLADHWRIPGFSGFSHTEIQQFINE